MKRLLILLTLLLPLAALSAAPVPIMQTLFTDVTGTVPGAEMLTHKAELFRQRTGIALYILVVPAMKEASLLRDGKRMLAQATANQPEMTGSVMIVITTQKPQVLLVGSYQAAQQLPDHILRLMVENQTLAYFHRGLMFQGVNTALDVLEAALTNQPTPPLRWYPPPEQNGPDSVAGNSFGFMAWACAWIAFMMLFNYTSRFRYAMKFTLAMTIGNIGWQAFCLWLANRAVSVANISLGWALMIGVATFFAVWLWTRKRHSADNP